MNAVDVLLPVAERACAETWRAMLRPPPVLSVSEWADSYRVLAGKAASEPGPWRTTRTPYLRAIMDALSSRDPTQLVVVQKGSQVGMTEAGNNWLGYIIDRAPGPILAVTPTDQLAKRASKQRIAPLIEATPALAHKVRPPASRDASNTMLMKDFPGGVLVLTGANSAVGLRSMPARYLFLDEVDAYPQIVGAEGNPLDLAERAARTFGRRRKIFVVSTPLRKLASHVCDAFNGCERAFDYHVPCPFCGHAQALVWEQMRWTVPEGFEYAEDKQGRLRSIPGVQYECVACQQRIAEHHKTAMLTWGSWVARWDRGATSIGFFINALYSPVGWFSWGEAAAMYERARQDISKEQVFVNTVLGLPYEEPSEAPDWSHLAARRESYSRGTAPAGVRFVTCGVDFQDDRIEATVIGWGRQKRSWVIDHLILPCGLALAERSKLLDDLVAREWPCAGGGSIPVWCIAVDSGTYTQDIYAWARRQLMPLYGGTAISIKHPRTVLVCKGFDRWGTPLLPAQKVSAEEKKRGLKVVGVGVSGLKRELYLWLRMRAATEDEQRRGIEDPYGYMHFPALEDEWFRQLTAERLVRNRTRQGYDKEEWVKTRVRNEALDCVILARAASIACGLDRLTDRDWRRIEETLPPGLLAPPAAVPVPTLPLPERGVTASVLPPEKPDPPPPRPPRPVIRSRFMSRYR